MTEKHAELEKYQSFWTIVTPDGCIIPVQWRQHTNATLTDVLRRTRSRPASGFQHLTCLRLLPVKVMKPTIWLKRALSKALGTYSLSPAEKDTAVVKQRRLIRLVSRGSSRAARMHGLWGKPGVPKIWGCHHSGETSSAGRKRETKCTMHIAPRVFSWLESFGITSSPLQRCRHLETALAEMQR